MSKRVKKDHFSAIYLSVVVVFIIAIAVCAVKLYGYLEKYERDMPVYEIDRIMRDVFGVADGKLSEELTPDYSAIFEGSEIEIAFTETENDFVGYYRKLAGNGTVKARSISTGLSVDKKYLVSSDGEDFAEFYMSPVEGGGWKLKSAALIRKPNAKVRVRTIFGSEVYVNDSKVTNEYMSEPRELGGVLSDGTNASFVVYSLYGFMNTPEVKAYDSNGDEITLCYDETTGSYIDGQLMSSGTATLTVYETSRVTVAGTEISESALVKSEIGNRYSTDLPDGIDGIYMKQYSLNWIGACPAIEVINRYGKKSELVDDGNGAFTESMFFDSALESEFGSYVLNCARTYAKYMTCDASRTALSACFETESEYYKRVINSDTWTASTKHECYFHDENSGEFVKFGDDIFVAHISFVQEIVDRNNKSELFRFDQNVYFRKTGDSGKYLIFDMRPNI